MGNSVVLLDLYSFTDKIQVDTPKLPVSLTMCITVNVQTCVMQTTIYYIHIVLFSMYAITRFIARKL